MKKIVIQKEGRALQCKCGYNWIYTGKSTLFASCPRCRTTVTINPKKTRNNESADIK